ERQAVEAAEAERVIAAARPNPTISYGRLAQGGGQPTIFEGSRQQQLTVELPLPLAGQREARMERAERAVAAARARIAAGASTLAAEAAAAYVGLLAAQEKLELVRAAGEETLRLREIVAAREAGGAASRYDVTRLDVELGRLRARLDD